MVWFQCEDCGENLKKPKLPNHFRICSAIKLSCIDCGVVFSQDSVQSHVQCITEAEKYGPKGQAKPSPQQLEKSEKQSKGKSDFDITVGLSQRPPWYCSLCNTSATSKQTLLGHAEGKKHRAKARAYHSANLPSKPSDCPVDNQSVEMKVDSSENKLKNPGGEVSVDNEKVKLLKRKDTTEGEENTHKIKWKRLIKAALKTNSERTMKFKKLKRIVFKSMKESGFPENESELSEIISQKIISCSRFQLDGKTVRLVAKV